MMRRPGPLDSMTELALTELAPTVVTVLTVLAASAAAFALAVLSAVAGFGGGVLLLPVFTVLFGMRVAVRVVAG
jgi:hypothetical protein